MNDETSVDRLRERCQGDPPLTAYLESWMRPQFDPSQLDALVREHGSPLNVLSVEPFKKRVAELRSVGDHAGVDLDVYFARKANKCLRFVEAMIALDGGIDVASEVELRQSLICGCPGERIICTAAVKNDDLLAACIANGVTVAVDNADEMAAIERLAREHELVCSIALRLSGFTHEGETLESRFGMPPEDALRHLAVRGDWVRVDGLHFHLHGYSAAERISALTECLGVVDELRGLGHEPNFIDMGGGFPISYLKSPDDWDRFWRRHRQAVMGDKEPITHRAHGLGLSCFDGQLVGDPNVYPYYQKPTSAAWLEEILSATTGVSRVADQLTARGLTLRCEPGRALLNGAGFTAAEVVFTKLRPDGLLYVGLSMNRTQCRTGSDDFLVDPIVLRPKSSEASDSACEGFLVGAYCTESELLSLRRLRFPRGIAKGDLVVFPNTAGYFMHFLESRSHQFPLAKNLFVDDVGDVMLDPIDMPEETPAWH